MIRTLYRSSKGGFTFDVPTTHWRVALHDAGGLFWVDFSEEPPEVVEPFLRDVFGFHALVVNDVLREGYVAKIDNWGEYVYAVLHAVRFNTDTLELVTREIDALLSKNYLVTYHAQPIQAVNHLWSSCQNDQRRLELADGLAELVPRFRVLDTALQLPPHRAQGAPQNAAALPVH